MIPKVEYLDAYELIMAQRKAVFEKIYKITNSRKIYPGIKIDPNHPLNPEEIPGVKEAGYVKDFKGVSQVKPKSPLYTLFKKIIAEASAQQVAWPFLVPVTGVPDYYDVIKEPMGTYKLTFRFENTGRQSRSRHVRIYYQI